VFIAGGVVMRRILRVLIGVAIIATVLPANVSAADGWIQIDNSKMPLMLNGRTSILQGTRDADKSCRWDLTLDHLAGTPPVAAVELAYSPSTCQQRIEIGDGRNFAAPGISSGAVPAYNLPQQGYLYTYWHDPIWIVLTSVQPELRWNYDGTYITQVVAFWDYVTTFNIPLDNWYVISHTGPTLATAYNDTWATVTSSATFYNTQFCGGTGTSIQGAQIVGLGSGSDRGYVSSRQAWGCSANLLGFVALLY
jgi:hypothetical protein